MRAVFLGLALSLSAASAAASPLCCAGPVPAIEDFDPTSPGLHDYVPPTPVGRGHGNASFGGGYMEFLFSGGRTPRLPPRRIYAGPLHSEPFGNRRLRLRESPSSRAGVYIGLPKAGALRPLVSIVPLP